MALLDFSRDDLSPLAGWPATSRGTGVLADLLRLRTRYQTWRARRETVRQLAMLDDRALRDLDITPLEIESLVYSDINDRTRCYDRNWWRNDTTRLRDHKISVPGTPERASL